MNSFPIGLLENISYTNAESEFPPGTSILMYSDGVTDIQVGPGTPIFEEASLLQYIHLHKEGNRHSMVNSLLSYISHRAHHDDFQDDITIFHLKRTAMI